MTNLVILPELKKLLPPLTEEEYAGLEKDIVARGCLSPIFVWNNAIVDGHNRYEICQKHRISFGIVRLEFASMDDARFWAWTHQEHRRNMTPFQRSELALQFKPIITAKAKEKKSAAGGDRKSKKAKSVCQTSDKPISEAVDTKKELAKTAGVSHDTMHKAEFLSEHADEETKENLRQGKTTINREYKRAKEKVADPKPKKVKSNKTNEKPLAEEMPQETEKTPSRNVPCIEELTHIVRTTLQNIRQDTPDHLLRSLASHFRKGFIEDLVLEAMEFLHQEKGSAVTIPIAEEIAKRYLKSKRK